MNSPVSRPLLAITIATAGVGTFSAMDALMKDLSMEIGAYNAMLWRMTAAVGLALGLFIWRGPRWPKPAIVRLHVWRSLVLAVLTFLFFWGLTRVPLAEATGLTFIAPLIALYLAVVLLKETLSAQSILASLIGFTGTLVILGGRMVGQYDTGVLMGIVAVLLSAVLFAYNLILQRQQALVSAPIEIAFFQSLFIALLYWLLAPFLMEIPPVAALPAVLGSAALGLVSVLLLSWAYAQAEASVLIPVEYSAFVWAALLGWLMFAEAVSLATMAGTALIVIGCLIAARQPSGIQARVETTSM